MNKILKKTLIGLGIFIAIILLANLVLNLALNYYLPKYIKDNTDYKVSYKSIDVDISTGNIRSTGIKISNLNPKNQDIIGLSGDIGTLQISRLGMYDALFNKKISSDELLLEHPNLKITLAKPVDKKSNKEKKPILLKNITIKNGNISIVKHTQKPFLSVNELNLTVSNLRMTKESIEKKLPVVFDQYSISGKNFFIRPDEIYDLKAKQIKTENGEINILDFQLKPLLTYAQFIKKFPKKRNLFDFETREMSFKDIKINDEKISLSEVRFEQPFLKMYTTSAQPEKKEKSFTYEVMLQNVLMNQSKILIIKPNGRKLFSGEQLDMNLSKLAMNEETAKGNIPFKYEKFYIKGSKLNYISETQEVKVEHITLDTKSAQLENVLLKPTVTNSYKTLINANAKLISLKLNDWSLEKNKLKLDAQSLHILGFNGTIDLPKQKYKSKPLGFGGIQFPIKLNNFILEKANINFNKGEQNQALNTLNIKAQNIELNEQTIKNRIPCKIGNYSITAKSFSSKINQYYELNTGLIKANNQSLQVNQFALKPRVSRSQFIRMIPVERDMYTISVNQIAAQGNLNPETFGKSLDIDQLNISNIDANIFRSTIPKDDNSEKPLYSTLLRSIKIPLVVRNTNIKNSVLVYEEDTEKSKGPGKLTFTNFNLNIKNINSGKTKNTKIPVQANALFMGVSPLQAHWTLDTASLQDAFTIKGSLSNLPAPEINPFLEPYLKIKTEGKIEHLMFDFRGNRNGINGNFKIAHKDLKVNILNDDGEKRKLLTTIANIIIKKDSKPRPSDVEIGEVKHAKHSSFFNLFWKGILEGLKKTLI
ncbi:DUF748 domain-containing protein [Riemerella anatipestifer]|uniref:DUF748 domain-containing protein n=1 Tax=Riemerella anatipestifer TaxID=34085 RepID=UPI0012AE6852|nr:DUF748 domain-containing protein [Riemerella anatipestifer]USL94945.1 DUF748 domain-containing protein [Riemerella anatipestifer]